MQPTAMPPVLPSFVILSSARSGPVVARVVPAETKAQAHECFRILAEARCETAAEMSILLHGGHKPGA